MRSFIAVVICLGVAAASAFADNFIEDSAWTNTGVTMPKTPLPPIESVEQAISQEQVITPDIPPDFRAAPAQRYAPPPRAEQPPVMAGSKLEFWVQVGAFADLANANSLASKIRSQGYNSRVFPSDLNRVAVGPYLTRDQAERARNAIRSIKPDAFLTTGDRL
ncbi:MAG: SPOR domain-containing protein [Helicobacteraceae bacterium]|nr:SPOR domain-containing protein [Helicobacteraceae bacterium]